MTFPWMNLNGPCPVVEFHDVRTEKFRLPLYLGLLAEGLTPPLTAAGATALGTFRVDNHPDRLIVLRGFAGIAARRRALRDFYAGPDWSRHRAETAELLRDERVLLTRAVTPGEGLRTLRPDEPVLALISELRFAEQIGNYHLWLRLLLRKAGLDPFAAFATLEAVNDVPAVPVVRNRSQHVALLRPHGRMPELPPELRNMLRYPPELLTLEPAWSLVA